MRRDVVFDKLSMLHSKFDEDLSKVEDVTKKVKVDSSTIKNIIDQKQTNQDP